MKKWLTYIMVAMFCIGLASCADVMDEGGGCPEGKATVRLKISMPTAEGAPYSVARETTGEERGSEYENTIKGTSDIHIYVFNNGDGSCMGEVTGLQLSGNDYDITREITGVLPDNVYGKSVRLVMMANYESRGVALAVPGIGTKYADWKKNPTFGYGTVSWSVADGTSGKYIPMSGECVLTVAGNMGNSGEIPLERAVAKVRIKVADGCDYSIASLQAKGAKDKGFCLAQDPFAVPAEGASLENVLKFTGNEITSGKQKEFYLPEQTPGGTSLELVMSKPGKGNTVENVPVEIRFKDYEAGSSEYEVRRNTIYEFLLSKGDDSGNIKTDVKSTVKKWVVEEINSDYE